ncbi:hypothetical protein PGIGA_G00092540 [Pangasianodon gigas]|uniref:Uncharacterized protein n=1 Tax=Pangasianodon gigas TaxID=30993 RepID=A0ACC5XCA0_PANGG|nr:hypothetical protein [Pangasianodon gigas]
MAQRKKVAGSDESRFLLHHVDGQARVHRLPGEEMAPGCTMTTCHRHPFMVFPNGSGLFQRDNASCHTVKIVQEWFEEHDKVFKVLTWPPNSPDLNPIGHLWDVLDKQVRSMEAPPRNLQELKDLALMSWCQIPQHTFREYPSQEDMVTSSAKVHTLPYMQRMQTSTARLKARK